MARPDSQSSDRVLLVEGQDDKHVVRHLCNRHESTPSFSISDKDNITQLLESLALEMKVSGRQAVGILVDANDDVTGRWNAIQNRLRRADIEPPPSPVQTGQSYRPSPVLVSG